MDKISLALDWTPNTIHSGLLIASLNGWYSASNIDIEFLSPEIDNYQKYPIHRLADGEVDMAMAPSEHVMIHNLKNPGNRLVAIAPVFQKDTSIMVAKKKKGILRPLDLEQKEFLGYNTYFEQEILRKMIQSDGGVGEFTTKRPEKLSVWESFLKDEGDVCWVFTSWEYAQATFGGIELSTFHLADFGVPYGYSPCIIIRESSLDEKRQILNSFIEITSKGYQFSSQHPLETARKLHSEFLHPNFKDPRFIEYSLNLVKEDFLDQNGKWGKFDLKRWQDFIDWISKNALPDASFESSKAEDFMVQLN